MDRRDFLRGAAVVTVGSACGWSTPLLRHPYTNEVDSSADSGVLSVDASTLSLDSGWKFRSGDDLNWAKLDLDDKDWVGIWPYYSWDLQNIDCHGYAWHRVKFRLPSAWQDRSDKLYFYLGRINGTEQSYLNAQLLGANGKSLGPDAHLSNAFTSLKDKDPRIYVLSTKDERLNWKGNNVLAIRVYDEKENGGFNKGAKLVSIHDPGKTYIAGWHEEYPIPRDEGSQIEMGDNWKVKVGDDPRWKDSDFDDSNWKVVKPRDDPHRDEVTWFRTQLLIPSSLRNNRYFNNELVFNLGRLHDKVDFFLNGSSLEEYRLPSRDIVKYYPYALECVYYVPSDAPCIKWDEKNVLAVRAYNNHDWWGAGFRGGNLFVANFFDLVDFNFNRLPYEIQARTPIDIDFTARSYSHKRRISATLEYKVYDRLTRQVADTDAAEIDIYNDRNNAYHFSFLPLANTDYLLWYRLTEKETGDNYARERLLGYKPPPKELRFTRQPIHWDHKPYDKADVKFVVENKVKDRLIPISPGGQTITGLLGQRMNLNSAKALWGFVNDFEVELLEGYYDRPQKDLAQGEFLGKYVHGMVRDLSYRYDDGLRQRLDKIMDILIASVDPDGYSGTHIYPVRWLSLDVWEQKYNLYALLYYYGLTGYEPALAAAQKIGDLLCATFGDEPGKLNIIKTGYHLGMQPTSVLEPMVFLYRYTSEQKYFDFCTHIVTMWEKPYGPKLISEMLLTKSFPRTGNGKSYEQTSCYLGLIRYYQLTGNNEYLKVLEYAFNDLAENRTYITGSNSEGEFVHQYIGNGDIATWPCESCATAHWMQFCVAMFHLTGNLKYADEIEKTTYNHLLASENPDSGGIAYYSPLQNAKPFSYGIACCNSSLPRVITMIPDVLWTQFADGGMAVLIYNQARMGDFIKAANGKKVFVELNIQSDFPKSGHVAISVDPAEPTAFRLALRVPTWTQVFKVTVDGRNFSSRPGEYVDLTRTWKAGDRIDVSMEMNDHLIPGQSLAQQMRREEAHPAKNQDFFEKYGNFANEYAIKHGPQVLAIDGSLSKLDDAGQATLDLDQPMSLQSVDDILPNGWVGNQAYTCAALGCPSGKPVVLVPFSDAGQTGGDMRVWIKKV
jgi:uncharacterized protein